MENDVLLRSWQMLALRGVIAFAFGLTALVWPGLTLLWLVALFAAYSILAGVASVLGAMNVRKGDERWWLILFLGLGSIAAGVVAVVYPGVTVVVLVLLLGANALMTGALDLIGAVRLRKHIRGEWLLILSGVISIAFGIVVVLFPLNAGALALVWLVSLYAMTIGILFLVQAYRVRTWARHAGSGSSSPVGSS